MVRVRMEKLKHYLNFVKFEHTLFSLPLIFAGAFLAAKGVPPWKLIILIIIAGTAARTAALALNRIIDRSIDAKNPRTSQRELPSGKLTGTSAYGVLLLGLAAYFAAAYLICPLVLYLSPIPLVIFIVYPYMKRFTPFCHFGVGLGLATAPLGGWIAVTCSLDNIFPAVILSLFTFFWVSGFDIIYATLDEEFDRQNDIYSMVAVYGRDRALLVSQLLHYLAYFAIAFLYFYMFKTYAAALLMVAVGVLLYYEHQKAEDVDLAFFRINILVGAAVFLFVLAGLYLP